MNSILFRADDTTDLEMRIASKYFDVYTSRMQCSHYSTIIGRYSVLPYYQELENDLYHINSSLINTYRQHKWIANFEYYDVIKDYTFKTWTDRDFYTAPEGQYVVKGKTNSRKHQWNTHMFAASKRDALLVANKLVNDPLIGPQEILYREYIPLKTFELGINGLPFTNEWRFFFLGQNLLCYNYYWSNAQYIPESSGPKPVILANHIAKIVSQYVNFFVLDVAETESGEWKLVEINDGQMSGLSCCDPELLYLNLHDWSLQP